MSWQQKAHNLFTWLKIDALVLPAWITRGCFLTAQTRNKRPPNDSLCCRLWPRLLLPVLWIFGTHMNIFVFFFPAGPKPCRLFLGHTLKCYILGSSWVRGKDFRQGMGLEREKEQMSLKLLVSVTLDRSNILSSRDSNMFWTLKISALQNLTQIYLTFQSFLQ